MRSHQDLEKHVEVLHKPACEFNDKLAPPKMNPTERKQKKGPLPATTAYHVVDDFTCSLDLVGLLDMREHVEATVGLTELGDSFGQSAFLSRMFDRYPNDSP